MSATVSVIVRCLNEERHIGRLLAGLCQQTRQPNEVIVVDSGSSDATVSVAARWGCRVVTVTPEEFSFGRALNRGCEAATGEVLVIASAHVYPVYTDWIERLLAPFADPAVALSYGRQIGNEVTKYAERQVFARWFPARSALRQPHSFCNNANAAVRRNVWRELRYDETLTGLEDIDLARRAQARGGTVSYVAEAEVVHVHEEGWRQIYNRYRREAIALARIDPHSRCGFLTCLRLFVVNVASDYFHAWHDGCLRPHTLAIPMFRWMQFWGTYRGARQRGQVPASLRQTFYYPQGFQRPALPQGHRAAARVDYAAVTESR